jgi:hypothetical protein
LTSGFCLPDRIHHQGDRYHLRGGRRDSRASHQDRVVPGRKGTSGWQVTWKELNGQTFTAALEILTNEIHPHPGTSTSRDVLRETVLHGHPTEWKGGLQELPRPQLFLQVLPLPLFRRRKGLAQLELRCPALLQANLQWQADPKHPPRKNRDDKGIS